jgi:hypothetical protein
VDIGSKTNAVILLDMCHTLRENTHRRNKERQETQNLKVFDVPTEEELI